MNRDIEYLGYSWGCQEVSIAQSSSMMVKRSYVLNGGQVMARTCGVGERIMTK